MFAKTKSNMLTKVTITDNKNTPFSHVADLWENGTSWEFKPGVNIIVGENGSGKSTLLNLIATYALCTDGMVSKIPDEILKLDNLFTSKMLDGANAMKDGCVVNMDYNGVVYRYSPAIEQKHNEDILGNIDSFRLYMSSLRHSMGEGMIAAFCALIDKMKSEKDIQFPINEINGLAKKSNPVWSERFKMLLHYYANNQVIVNQDNFEYTVLMDEPDRNLDIVHIKELYNVLSYHMPMTQLVVVIHNPVLINKMSMSDVNIIEMTPHYIEKVKNFIKWTNQK